PVIDVWRDVGNSSANLDLLAVDQLCLGQLLASDKNRIVDPLGKNLVINRLFREPKAKQRPIFFGTPANLVMHVELDVHTRRNAFGSSRVMALVTFARRLTDKLERSSSREGILAKKDLAGSAFTKGACLTHRLSVQLPDRRAILDCLAVYDLDAVRQLDHIGDRVMN